MLWTMASGGTTTTVRMIGDEVRLVLPAQPEYGRIARITASSLALRLAFTFPQIEDLRLAVDEAIILLLRPQDDEGTITITFQVSPDRLVVDAEASGRHVEPVLDDEAVRRFEQLVAETVDAFELDRAHSRVHLEKLF
jgi:anti-sigma regulatory factor (Ser/Thr protein kinase)